MGIAAVLGTVLAWAVAAPAGAAPPAITRCSELAADGRVEGIDLGSHLWVDVDCHLTDVVVRGTVYSYEGATLTSERVRVHEGLYLRGDAQLRDTVVGWVSLDPPANLSAESSTVRGSVVGRAGIVSLRYARVSGDYDVTTSDIARLQSTTVAGSTTSRGGRLVVHDSTFLGTLHSIGNGDVLVCRAAVLGDLRVEALTDYARLGVEGRQFCRSEIRGSVILEDNPHSIDLGPLFIDGDLVCTGNTGPRGITGLREVWLFGIAVGQCRP
ncbi:hypothetical protein [Cellulomonas cellasea]|uniref:Polymer-forming cytoskeletal protein n=2 Tax=Cellulomonas cellasea TaxID=43670 RepID=A0A0A0B5Y5_9CELL|nr:hypothetical protein [Cellulomonas cellasea]KGM01567.1 hypothetical protein Q760_18570 [Cellulomonas cellasea DSM 20118]GEA87901.1 hypothetical protein CCE01nite_18500 [Cellulomonas cellasea]